MRKKRKPGLMLLPKKKGKKNVRAGHKGCHCNKTFHHQSGVSRHQSNNCSAALLLKGIYTSKTET